jgi:hypothetical protein
MKSLFILLCLLLCGVPLTAEEAAKDPIKLKLAMLDALQSAPDAYFTTNNVWIFAELGKGTTLKALEKASPKKEDLDALEALATPGRRDKAREAILRITDPAVLVSLSDKVFGSSPADKKPTAPTANNKPAAEPAPEPNEPDEVVREGCDKAAELLSSILTADEKEEVKKRQFETAMKRIDVAAGKVPASELPPEGNNTQLQKDLYWAPSAAVDGKALVRIKLIADGYSWEEMEERLKKVPAATLTALDKLPLGSRRSIACDSAYYIRDRDLLQMLTPQKK